jgi:hypothetical protein
MIAALAVAALIQQAGPAMAQAAPAPHAAAAQAAPLPAPDEAKLALSRQIIAVIMPTDQRATIIKRMETALLASMGNTFRLPPGVDDPGLSQILQDYLKSVPTLLEPVMAQHMPGYFEAMARAYARNFTQEELEQVLAFAHTPAGAKYLSRAPALMQDPDVSAAIGEVMRAAQQTSAGSVSGLQAKIRAYLAQHPDVAKKLEAAGKKPS